MLYVTECVQRLASYELTEFVLRLVRWHVCKLGRVFAVAVCRAGGFHVWMLGLALLVLAEAVLMYAVIVRGPGPFKVPDWVGGVGLQKPIAGIVGVCPVGQAMCNVLIVAP